MSCIVGAVFVITLLNCVFGLIDQVAQRIKAKRRARK